jgi:hypothetical protein
MDFNRGKPARREDQVADLIMCTQHGRKKGVGVAGDRSVRPIGRSRTWSTTRCHGPAGRPDRSCWVKPKIQCSRGWMPCPGTFVTEETGSAGPREAVLKTKGAALRPPARFKTRGKRLLGCLSLLAVLGLDDRSDAGQHLLGRVGKGPIGLEFQILIERLRRTVGSNHLVAL